MRRALGYGMRTPRLLGWSWGRGDGDNMVKKLHHLHHALSGYIRSMILPRYFLPSPLMSDPR